METQKNVLDSLIHEYAEVVQKAANAHEQGGDYEQYDSILQGMVDNILVVKNAS